MVRTAGDMPGGYGGGWGWGHGAGFPYFFLTKRVLLVRAGHHPYQIVSPYQHKRPTTNICMLMQRDNYIFDRILDQYGGGWLRQGKV